MNHEGCSNTLTEECTKFHREFGKVIKLKEIEFLLQPQIFESLFLCNLIVQNFDISNLH